MANKKMFKVRLDKSLIGRLPNHRKSVRGLGLRKIGQVVEVEDTVATRGMYKQVAYMVSLVEESQ